MLRSRLPELGVMTRVWWVLGAGGTKFGSSSLSQPEAAQCQAVPVNPAHRRWMFGKRTVQRGDASGTALPPRLCLPPKPSRPLKTFVWGLNPPGQRAGAPA